MGIVASRRIEPAIEAVKKWRFEPALKGVQRVACAMRAPIRFRPS
jgi:hypothetical protein